MSGYKTIDILCHNENCEHKWYTTVERARQDERFFCPKCGHDSWRTISSPMILQASWPDGHTRSDGMGRAMEIDRLENQLDAARDSGDTAAMADVIKEMGAKQSEGGGT